MGRGTLRIFLGAAPGVGKTFDMLEEAHRLLSVGEDVVVGFAMHHGRPETRALLAGLAIIPPKILSHRGSDVEEMDIDAVLSRRPATAVVDEFAHSNVPGSRNLKRWQDIEELLAAGIHVLSTVDIQHLASLGDVVSAITEVEQAETVPDEVVRRADQIELVDITPELLRQRLGAGKVYAHDKIDAALANYFRVGNLTALRELALLWLADRVDEGLSRYRAAQGISTSWPARERVIVGLTGGPEGELLIRRAARILTRVSGGDLLALHVRPSHGVLEESPVALEAQKRLITDLGGSYHVVAGDDPAESLLEFARSVNATQIVLGVSRRHGLGRIITGVGSKVVRGSGDIDVHMVSHSASTRSTGTARHRDLSRRRIVLGLLLAGLLPALLQLVLNMQPGLSLTTGALLQLTGAVAVALIGGLTPAIVAALWSSLLLNYFMTEPTGTLIIHDPDTVVSLIVFTTVSAVVAVIVDVSARRAKEAARARAEATTLSELTRIAIASEESLQPLLEQAREVFQVQSAALFTRASDEERITQGSTGPGTSTPAPWRLAAGAGLPLPSSPSEAESVEDIDADTALALSGRTLSAADRRLLAAFGAQVTAIQARQQLVTSNRDNLRLVEGNKMRTSILRAVSHDLRTPLAGIKLAVSSLRQRQVRFSSADRQELLATIENYSDRLDHLVGNLLDMSRITSDSVTPLLQPVRWRDVLPAALQGTPGDLVRVDLPANMPPIDADPGMLERVIANVAENAVKYAPASDIVIVGAAGGAGDATIDGQPASELRIIDHGQGVGPEKIMSMFRPFQRFNDNPSSTGIGLGLAVAKGFTEAMAGTLTAEQTPGGGLTVVIRLPLSAGAEFPAPTGAAAAEPRPRIMQHFTSGPSPSRSKEPRQ
ncbi:ATP-binding protein [Micrococcaceae bacterium Sec5.7]